MTVGCLLSPIIHAEEEEVASLPTIQVMADAEMREEVGFIPFQEDKDVRKALQHRIIKSENDIQNTGVVDTSNVIVYTPRAVAPDMSQLTPLQREYVLSVASALQSNDPTSGIFKMLEPLGIDRSSALDNIRNGGGPMQIKFNENQLNGLLGDKWKDSLPK